jgi:arsenite methyltransferase
MGVDRVLKPGGRLAVSDIALKQPLPSEIGNDLMAYVGCIAGAILIEDYRAGLLAAGFAPVQVVDSEADLIAYAKLENQSSCCSPAMAGGLPIVSDCSSELHSRLAELLTRYNINDYAASVKVFAVKPA